MLSYDIKIKVTIPIKTKLKCWTGKKSKKKLEGREVSLEGQNKTRLNAQDEPTMQEKRTHTNNRSD